MNKFSTHFTRIFLKLAVPRVIPLLYGLLLRRCSSTTLKQQHQKKPKRNMGQALKKLTHGSDEKKEQEIAQMADKYFISHFGDANKNWTVAELYQAVCEAVEELNKNMGSTQIKVPKTEVLKGAFNKHHKREGEPVSKEEFEKIIRDVILDTGVTGIGAKDMLMYIFGVPLAALLIKRRVIPKLIPEELFIPGVTSATVFALAVFNKL